jgi:Leucine-rich repeat (LRR) protein
LLGCVALRELSLQRTRVRNESFAELGPLLARLHKLDLSKCEKLKAISNLAPATSLRQLTLADSGIVDLGGLEKLVALETLDVTDLRLRDWTILRQCPRLVTLTRKVPLLHWKVSSTLQQLPSSIAACTSIAR